MKQRIFALLLALVMGSGLLCLSVLAAERQPAQDAAPTAATEITIFFVDEMHLDAVYCNAVQNDELPIIPITSESVRASSDELLVPFAEDRYGNPVYKAVIKTKYDYVVFHNGSGGDYSTVDLYFKTAAGTAAHVVYVANRNTPSSGNKYKVTIADDVFRLVSRTPAGCLAPGSLLLESLVTGETVTEPDPDAAPLGHAFGDWAVATPAGCTEPGEELRICTRCGEKETRAIDALGHTPGEAVRENEIPATCTEPGGYDSVVYCTVCHAELSREHTERPALGHTPGEAVKEKEIAATCTEAGGYDMVTTCAVCGTELKREHTDVPALGHDWGEWCPIPMNFCTDPRIENRTCNRCGATESRTLPPDGHTPGEPVKENAIAPTCEAAGGYDMVVYCSTCGAEIRREHTDTPALGHEWSEPEYVWADDLSSCTANRVCKHDAGHIETEAATVTSEITLEPTVEAEGERTYTAVFENPAFQTQTRTEAIDKLEPPAPVNPFVDVKEGAYYYDAVLWAVNAEPQITNGTDATHFSPGNTCTRAQVVTFLWRAMGCPAPQTTDNPFTDVTADKYYTDAVLWAVENEITNGMTATSFAPGRPCTRAQVVTFLWRAEHKPAPTSTQSPFSDVTGGYYYDAVLWAVERGITNGMTATTFVPDGPCTRGQIVTFLYRNFN